MSKKKFETNKLVADIACSMGEIVAKHQDNGVEITVVDAIADGFFGMMLFVESCLGSLKEERIDVKEEIINVREEAIFLVQALLKKYSLFYQESKKNEN